MSDDHKKPSEDRAFEALIVSQLWFKCDDKLEVDKLPPLTAEEREVMNSLGDDFIDGLLAAPPHESHREKPQARRTSGRRELAYGLNRAEEISEEAEEELRRKREEALKELEEENGKHTHG